MVKVSKLFMRDCKNIEIWRPIKGFEGFYEVSDYGRVRSLNYNRTGEERILKPGNVRGYLCVTLCKNGKPKHFKIHRLVLQTFNPVSNMDELTVDHINLDKTDNRLTNLRYATIKEQKYFDNQEFNFHAKKVYQYTKKSGEFVREWNSTREIERELGYSRGNISDCCRGVIKSAYQFLWSYKPPF